MSLPKAIQREVEAAEAATAAMSAQPAPPVIETPAQLPTPTQAELAPAPAPAPVAQPPAQPQVPDYWEQRFRTVQGMYNNDIPKLQQAAKAADDRNKELEQRLQALEKPAAQTPAPVNPQDAENFGADLVEMVQRQAQASFAQLAQEAMGHIQRLGSRIDSLEQNITGVARQTELTLDQQFYMQLAKLMPDWEAINVNPQFLTWLEQADPVYGVPRQAALQAAHQRSDAVQVAAVFNAWKTGSAQAVAQPQDALASMVAPRSDGGSTPPTQQPAKPIIPGKYVEEFFNNVARGRYVGREAEAQRIEAEINSAAAEGRIR